MENVLYKYIIIIIIIVTLRMGGLSYLSAILGGKLYSAGLTVWASPTVQFTVLRLFLNVAIARFLCHDVLKYQASLARMVIAV